MDIAKALDLHASSFSTLINKVFRPLTQINSQSKGADAAIQSLFAAVNNLSEVRVRRKLEGYLQRMAELEEEVRFNGDADDAPVYVNQLIVDTPHEILRMLEGVYECYYLSSFGSGQSTSQRLRNSKIQLPASLAYGQQCVCTLKCK